jgi:nucleotide-binding universal stress UspA family protein
MRDSLFLAIDQFEPGQAAVDFAIGLAAKSGSDVRVFHVRELSRFLRVPPLETVGGAELLVADAVHRIRAAGVSAEGGVRSAREENVARCIVDGATEHHSEAIVLGSLRLRGLQRLSGHGVRERVLQLSSLPVIVTPTALQVRKRILAS